MSKQSSQVAAGVEEEPLKWTEAAELSFDSAAALGDLAERWYLRNLFAEMD